MSDPLAFLARAPSDAPSELTLDRYLAGELTPDARAEVERWLAESPDNEARLAARRSFDHPADGERLFAGIERRLETETATSRSTSRRRWWQRLWGPGTLAIVMAALLLVTVQPWGPGDDIIIAKGNFGFLVHRKTVSASEVLVSGATVRPGDVLRFEVDLPEAAHLIVIDEDPSGALAIAWPLDGGEASRRVEAGSRPLDGAVALDDTLGRERLHAVVCADPIESRQIERTGAGVLALPDGCRTQAIELVKKP